MSVDATLPIEGDPVAPERQPRAPRACSYCRQTGHNWATCGARLESEERERRGGTRTLGGWYERELDRIEEKLRAGNAAAVVVTAAEWPYVFDRLQACGYALVEAS